MDFIHNRTWPVFYDYIPVYKIWIKYTNVFKRYRPETIFHTEIKSHKSDNNWWILSKIELLFYDYIPLYEIWTQFTIVVKRCRPETIFLTEIKGHNSDNNRWILSVIKPDLYFMIIYLCMKYESNTLMYSQDIARKPFFVRTGQDVRDVRMFGRTGKGDAICTPPL